MIKPEPYTSHTKCLKNVKLEREITDLMKARKIWDCIEYRRELDGVYDYSIFYFLFMKTDILDKMGYAKGS